MFKINKLPAIILMAGIFFCNIQVVNAQTLPKNDVKFTIKAMGKTYSFYYPEIDSLNGKIYLKNAEEVVDGIYLDTLKKPKDAKVEIFPDRENPFVFYKEEKGRGIDKQDLLLKIEKALNTHVYQVEAKEEVVMPTLSCQKLKQSTYRRAFFTTQYQYSSQERKDNINLCAKYIGGVTLFPNEEFSFNEIVGKRSEERGFKGAKIIENGKFTDGIGGGVCQVSTTMYNAVLLSGLLVTERHSHSMSVSYVEPSFDAMVSSDYADFKFINNTNNFVHVIAYAKNDSITISIYGSKMEYTYARISEIIEKIPPQDPIKVGTSDLLVGEEKVLVYSKDGIKSRGYLEKYKNGILIDKRLLTVDYYKPLQGEILFGQSAN